MNLNLKSLKEMSLLERFNLLWDFCIVYLALVNVILIIFDFTYLYCRPIYLNHTPVITKWYDPILGIEPHRHTKTLLEKADQYAHLLEQPQSSILKIKDTKVALIRLSKDMLKNNPFERAGLTGNLQKIRYYIKSFYFKKNNSSDEISSTQAITWFWDMSRADSQERFEYFDRYIRGLLTENYYRRYDLEGKFVDLFWLLDLPFYLLFLTELSVLWYLSVRRKVFAAWFLYPIYHWYDVLALVPMAQFRFFRLFRIISIYIRLKRSHVTNLGDDFISRNVAKYIGILKEELADMVTIRILEEVKDEIRSGASINLLTEVLIMNRKELKGILLNSMSQTIDGISQNQEVREILAKTLIDSAKEVPATKFIPEFIKTSITKQIGMSIYESFLLITKDMVEGRSKNQSMEKILDQFLDEIVSASNREDVKMLSEKMTIEIIDNIIERVAIKKWAQKDLPLILPPVKN